MPPDKTDRAGRREVSIIPPAASENLPCSEQAFPKRCHCRSQITPGGFQERPHRPPQDAIQL